MNVNELWHGLSCLIRHRSTFDIGSIQSICEGILKETLCDEEAFVESVNEFLKKVIEHIRSNPHSVGQSLALILLDSLIYNIHIKHCPLEKNNFYASLSASQLSMSASQSSVFDRKSGLSYIQALAANKPFFHKIKIIFERNYNKDTNLHYIENLIETIEYVLLKNKLSKDPFLQNKKTLPVLMHSLKRDTEREQVDQIIFSNRINCILTLINAAEDTILYAICRIYYAAQHTMEQNQFPTIKYEPNQILSCLYTTYIESFHNKKDLFQDSLNPIYRLIKCQMQCNYMPVFVCFHHNIVSRMHFIEAQDFIKTNLKIIETDLINFLSNLPCSLMEYLKEFFDLVHANENNAKICLISVKRLLFNCFLFDPLLIQEVIEQIDIESYQKLCNQVLILFFSSNNVISQYMDKKILGADFHEEETLYIIEEPILNYDYSLIKELIKKVQFTPKDNRQFNLRKKKRNTDIIDSPIKLKKQINEEPEDLGLTMWMAVGGKQNYSKKPKQQKKISKKTNIISLPKDKMKQVKALYEKFTNQLQIQLGSVNFKG